MRGFLVAGVIAIFAVASGQAVKKVSLASAFGKDENAFFKALGGKFKKGTELIPDMVPGRMYTDEEREALPKINRFTWTGKVSSLGEANMGRYERSKAIEYFEMTFDAKPPKTYAEALSRLGLPAPAVKPKADADGGYGFKIKMAGKEWFCYFFRPNDPKFGHPSLSVSVN